MHSFRTEYYYRGLGKHSRNLAMSLHKQLHFSVFLRLLCFSSCVLIFRHFQDEKQDIAQQYIPICIVPPASLCNITWQYSTCMFCEKCLQFAYNCLQFECSPYNFNSPM